MYRRIREHVRWILDEVYRDGWLAPQRPAATDAEMLVAASVEEDAAFAQLLVPGDLDHLPKEKRKGEALERLFAALAAQTARHRGIAERLGELKAFRTYMKRTKRLTQV